MTALGPAAAWAQRPAPAIDVSSHGRTVRATGVLTGCYSIAPDSPARECADQQPVARRRIDAAREAACSSTSGST